MIGLTNNRKLHIGGAVLCLFLIVGRLSGQTYVTGDVGGTWDISGSPYIVTEEIHVNYGETLVIEPGVHVQFYEDMLIKISDQNADRPGQIIAKGTAQDSIIFEAFDKSRGWRGFFFQNSGNNDTLDYCVIRDVNAVHTDEALTCTNTGIITVFGGAPVIAHTTIHSNISTGTNCVRSVFELFSASPLVQYCKIINNQVRKLIDVHAGCALLIHNTLIAGNILDGLIFGDTALPTDPASRSIRLINVTISENRTESVEPILVNSFPAFIEITNCILWSTGIPLTVGEQDLIQMSRSDVDQSSGTLWAGKDWNGGEMAEFLILWGDVNFSADPQFRHDGPWSFTLGPESPCLDIGQDVFVEGDREDRGNPGMALLPGSGSTLTDIGAYGGWRETGDDPGGHTSAVVGGEHLTELPSEFYLGDNYPNPFNPGTRIRYSLPERTHVKLTIYNMKGQAVNILDHAIREIGEYEVTWNGNMQNGRPASSGIYYYHLEAGSFVQVKKMTLLR